MKKIFAILAIMCISNFVEAYAQTWVNGYYRSNGTYVSGHYRSDRNSTNHDNYSTAGNTNPFTGSTGYVAPDYSPQAYNYGSGHTIYTGPQGGQFYFNDSGNKTYVPKRNDSFDLVPCSSQYNDLDLDLDLDLDIDLSSFEISTFDLPSVDYSLPTIDYSSYTIDWL